MHFRGMFQLWEVSANQGGVMQGVSTVSQHALRQTTPEVEQND